MSSFCIIFTLASMFQSSIVYAEEEIYFFAFDIETTAASQWSTSSNIDLSSDNKCAQDSCWKQGSGDPTTLNLPTTNYQNLSISIDADTTGSLNTDECTLQYTTEAHTSALITVCSGASHPVANYTIDIDNSYKNNPTFKILLTTSNKHCFWDNLRVFGTWFTIAPTIHPSKHPTLDPTYSPSAQPTNPTAPPSNHPSLYPTESPTKSPTKPPTTPPTTNPSIHPTNHPSIAPTKPPTLSPSIHPTHHPSISPTHHPSVHPTIVPTTSPTVNPTQPPTQTDKSAPSDSESPQAMEMTGTVVIIVLCVVIICVISISLWLRAYYRRLQKVYINQMPGQTRTSVIKLVNQVEPVADSSPRPAAQTTAPTHDAANSRDRMLERVLSNSVASHDVSIVAVSTTQTHDIESDARFARQLQDIEEQNPGRESIDSQDARLALELQLKESAVLQEEEEPAAENKRRSTIIESDARYAQHLHELQLEDNATVNSADARYAIKLQLMESGVSFEDEEYSKQWRGSSIGADAFEAEDPAGAGMELFVAQAQPVAIEGGKKARVEDHDGNELGGKKAMNEDGEQPTALVLEDKEQNVILSDVISADFVVMGDDETQAQGKGEPLKEEDVDEGDAVVGNDMNMDKQKANDVQKKEAEEVRVDDELDEGDYTDPEEKDEMDDGNELDTIPPDHNDNNEKLLIEDIPDIIDHDLPLSPPLDVDDLPLGLDANVAWPQLPEDEDPIKEDSIHEAAAALQKVQSMAADEEYARELQKVLSREPERGSAAKVDSFDARMAIRLQLMESGVDEVEVFEFAQKQKMSVAADYAEDGEAFIQNEAQNEAQNVVDHEAKKQEKVKGEEEDSGEEDEIMAGLETLDFDSD